MTIKITVNGDQHSVPENCTLTDLLQLLEVEGRLAIDVNGEIIPRSIHSDHQLVENDRVEIVNAIGGG
jgi:thiamine biosynthesis protein ThiS